MPTIIRLDRHEAMSVSGKRVREEFQIIGDPESRDWIDHLRPPESAWCSFSLWDGEHVGSYGGSVWPMAWPSLFALVGPRGRQSHALTDAGREAIAAARGGMR